MTNKALQSYAMMAMAITLNVSAQVMLKRSGGAARTWIDLLFSIGTLPAIGAYFLSFILFSIILRSIPLSLASPILSGGTFLLASLAGVVAFGETLKPHQILGISLLVVGIVLISTDA